MESYIRKGSVMIIAIKMVSGTLAGRKSFQRCTVDEENVRPAVVVVIEYRDTGAGGFNNVFLGVHSPEHVRHRESSLLGDIRKVSEFGCRRSVFLGVCDSARQHQH